MHFFCKTIVLNNIKHVVKHILIQGYLFWWLKYFYSDFYVLFTAVCVRTHILKLGYILVILLKFSQQNLLI